MIWNIEKPKGEMSNLVSYASGTPERDQLLAELEKIYGETVEIPLIIGGEEVYTGEVFEVRCPHNHKKVLAVAHLAREKDLRKAIDVALEAHKQWRDVDWYHRVSVFLKAADLLAGPERIRGIARIMANMSKNPFEAEIDLAELVDFWRYGAYYLRQIYSWQPSDAPGEKNRFDYRPLEGFVLAITPFNFYSIGGNLPTTPAMVGNVALWKPSRSVISANYHIMQVLMKAGLPDGVVNFVPFSSKYTDVVLKHEMFA